MGGNRDHEQGLDVRPDDRAATGEGVGRGSGGGGQYHGVTAESRHAPAINPDGQLQHAGPVQLFDGGFVEGPPLVDVALGGMHLDVDSHAFFDAVIAVGNALDDFLQAIGFGFGEESDMAEVDAEQGGAAVPHKFRGPQDGAVPAEDQHEFRFWPAESVDGGQPQVSQSLFDLVGSFDGSGPSFVSNDEDVTAHQRLPGRSATARAMAASRSMVSSPRRIARKYSMLPRGPGSGLATTA